jgi:hypothetical protein
MVAWQKVGAVSAVLLLSTTCGITESYAAKPTRPTKKAKPAKPKLIELTPVMDTSILPKPPFILELKHTAILYPQDLRLRTGAKLVNLQANSASLLLKGNAETSITATPIETIQRNMSAKFGLDLQSLIPRIAPDISAHLQGQIDKRNRDLAAQLQATPNDLPTPGMPNLASLTPSRAPDIPDLTGAVDKARTVSAPSLHPETPTVDFPKNLSPNPAANIPFSAQFPDQDFPADTPNRRGRPIKPNGGGPEPGSSPLKGIGISFPPLPDFGGMARGAAQSVQGAVDTVQNAAESVQNSVQIAMQNAQNAVKSIFAAPTTNIALSAPKTGANIGAPNTDARFTVPNTDARMHIPNTDSKLNMPNVAGNMGIPNTATSIHVPTTDARIAIPEVSAKLASPQNGGVPFDLDVQAKLAAAKASANLRGANAENQIAALQARAERLPASMPNVSPDANGERVTAVEWDAWHKHFATVAGDALMASINKVGAPMGSDEVAIEVTFDNRVTVELTRRSNPKFDEAVLQAYRSLNKDAALNFPAGSIRSSVRFTVKNEHTAKGVATTVNSRTITGDKEDLRK